MPPSSRPEPSDAQLVRRFKRGDRDAFAALAERHERAVYNLAYRMLGNPEDARDAAQDALLSCYRHLASFRGDAAFSTWLHRIAVNACYDLLRRRRPTTSLDAQLVEPAPLPDHSDTVAASADVQRALLAVAEEYRVVLVLHEIQDLPVAEIAEVLKLPTGTVKSRLYRGRVALGRALTQQPEPRGHPASSNPPSP